MLVGKIMILMYEKLHTESLYPQNLVYFAARC